MEIIKFKDITPDLEREKRDEARRPKMAKMFFIILGIVSFKIIILLFIIYKFFI